MWLRYYVTLGLPLGSLFLASTVSAAPCENIAAKTFANTTITSVRIVAPGAFTLPADSPASDSSFFNAFGTLRAFCRVQGVIHPSGDSHIEFEVWLPPSGWNRKYAAAGNGGFGGTINYFRLAEAVNAGYAGSATDTGHRGTVTDRDWAIGHPEKVIDFNYRAIHQMAEKAKEIIRAFYSEDPARSYFNSCSNGGRQALVEAERYPADFDGILAGAPAFNYGRQLPGSRGQKTVEPDETDPNLKPFRDRGGKLILYHGANDDPAETIKYYRRIVSKMGQNDASEFVRLFVVPGMAHCGGGPLPDFGLRLQPRADPEHSMSVALEHWVENGIAPAEIIATKYQTDNEPTSGIVRTRPLCAFPHEAHWMGKGSPDDAANYRCVAQ